MEVTNGDEVVTVCYKVLNDNIPIFLKAYLPSKEACASPPGSEFPAVIYFHGGGLTVGNKESWFPTWLKNRVIDLGFVFISADYQLIPPSTGHDIIEDICCLFRFLVENEIKSDRFTIRIDPNRMAVSGSSAGGLCAYLAAMHCSPKPRAIFSIYGMGGDFLTPHYLRPKNEVFFRGRELLDPSDFPEFVYPFHEDALPPIVDSPLAYHPKTFRIPGYPANPRMLLARLYLQLGTFLDYYTGAHSPSISQVLRSSLSPDRTFVESDLPKSHRALFPQFAAKDAWPPTMLFHGKEDSAVPIEESRNLKALLDTAGIEVELLEFEGAEHSFDYEAGAEARWGAEFDVAKDFLHRNLA